MNFAVFMGAPGAGKSFAVNQIKNMGDYVFSYDPIRENKLVPFEYMRFVRMQVLEALEVGGDVIIDATNIKTSHRLGWLEIANKYNAITTLYVVSAPYRTLIQSQRIRKYAVPDSVVRNYLRNFNLAKEEIVNESWNEIKYINR